MTAERGRALRVRGLKSVRFKEILHIHLSRPSRARGLKYQLLRFMQQLFYVMFLRVGALNIITEFYEIKKVIPHPRGRCGEKRQKIGGNPRYMRR